MKSGDASGRKPRRSLVCAASTLAGVMSVAGPSSAGNESAPATQCIRTANEVPGLRSAGRMEEARRKGALCASVECPPIVRAECVRLVELLASEQPTIVVAAKDGRGRDLLDVEVALDGEAFRRDDGRERELDPGPHRLRVRRLPEIKELEIFVRVGEKRRRFDVTFAVASAREQPTSAPSTTPAPGGPSILLPAILVGAGVLTAGGALGVHLKTNADAEDLDRSCGHRCDPAVVSPLYTRYWIAAAMYGLGGAAIVGGIVLFYVNDRRASPARASLGLGAGGFVLRAAF